MGLFGKILDKLGLGDRDKAAPAPTPPSPSPSATTPPPPMPTLATPMSEVDVMAQLEAMGAANAQRLNWRTSIVDLLKLLDIDSSYAARKELAEELGCPPEKMADSAQMNMWLHKTVLRRIADNGGNVPPDLLD
jgi:hypothetical protein